MKRAYPILFVLASILLLTIGVPNAAAFPEPKIVIKSWQYDFQHDPPRPIAVHGIGGTVRWYWYITYKVTNNTGEERLFVPEIMIYTNTGKIFPAGKDVPAVVFNVIKEHLENPLLENPAEIVGQILQGSDHAKEGVAIWQAPQEDVDHLTIFVSGLSGETQAIKNPHTGKRVVVRKTLMIDYDKPGTTRNIQNQAILPRGQRWVMR